MPAQRDEQRRKGVPVPGALPRVLLCDWDRGEAMSQHWRCFPAHTMTQVLIAKVKVGVWNAGLD